MTILPSSDRKHRRNPRTPLHSPTEIRRPRGRFRRCVVLWRCLQPRHHHRRRRYHVSPSRRQAVGAGSGTDHDCLGCDVDGVVHRNDPQVQSSFQINHVFGCDRRRLRRGRADYLQVCIVVNNIGMLVVYMIIIGDVLSGTWSDGVKHLGLVEEWFGQHWWTTRFSLLLVTTLLVFAPLISFKRVGVAVVKMMDGSMKMPRLMPELANQASFWKLFTTIPILVTAYICHHNIHPIENELRDPSQMKSIVRVSLTLCSSVYIATSFFGFLLFGDHTLDDVLANFDRDLGIPYSSLLDDLVRVSYGIHLMLVFPIVFFSLRLNLDSLVFPYAIPISLDKWRFFSVTAALMGLIFIGANFVPSIWDAFEFTGATAAISVGFIFPAAVSLRDTHGITTNNDGLVSWVMNFLAVS